MGWNYSSIPKLQRRSRNFITRFRGYVITCPYCDLSWPILVKWPLLRGMIFQFTRQEDHKSGMISSSICSHSMGYSHNLLYALKKCYWHVYAHVLCNLYVGGNKFTLNLNSIWINIKMSSYQYRKSHFGDKTVVKSSYLNNGSSYTGKTTSLYWIRAQHHLKWSIWKPWWRW